MLHPPAMITRRLTLLALGLSLLGLPCAYGETTLVFGVLNQQNPQLTAQRWGPILAHVSEQAGVTLRLRMGATAQETDAMMGRGEFDFVFTNHNFQPEYDRMGWRVIARWAGEPIRCAIVVPADSPVRDLKELQGRRVAYANPDAFVGYAVPKMLFKAQGVHESEVFAGTQDAALTQLHLRQAEAAAVNSRFLEEYAARSGARFRVLYLSEPYPELAVIAHPRVPRETVERVRRALLDMKDDPQGQAVLARAKSPGFAPAEDGDYEGVRRVYRAVGR